VSAASGTDNELPCRPHVAVPCPVLRTTLTTARTGNESPVMGAAPPAARGRVHVGGLPPRSNSRATVTGLTGHHGLDAAHHARPSAPGPLRGKLHWMRPTLRLREGLSRRPGQRLMMPAFCSARAACELVQHAPSPPTRLALCPPPRRCAVGGSVACAACRTRSAHRWLPRCPIAAGSCPSELGGTALSPADAE